MKTKKIFFPIISVVLASSCSEEIGHCDLTEAQMQIIPYEMGQVISFIDNVGHTVDLTVIQNELGWNRNGIGMVGMVLLPKNILCTERNL